MVVAPLAAVPEPTGLPSSYYSAFFLKCAAVARALAVCAQKYGFSGGGKIGPMWIGRCPVPGAAQRRRQVEPRFIDASVR
jgi:hypothetical protein